jgi:hypothetical protein
MRCSVRLKRRTYLMGQSTIELALITPILLTLFLAVADFARAILFNNILINISREGANLASRTAQNPQFIIAALNDTSSPLEMAVHGTIFISKVKSVDGGSGVIIPVVEEQYRSINGDAALVSRLWHCTNWGSNGKCTLPVATSDRQVTLPFTLSLGYEVYVVEAIYTYTPLTSFFLKTSPQLYSLTLL